MIRNKSDIIIIGSGLIGLITAFCLAKLGFSITIIEKEKISNFNNSLKKDVRTTAIAEGTKIILDRFNFWDKIKKFTEPIKHIKVYDRNSSNKISFKNESAAGYLGYIIENKFIKKILVKEISNIKNITLVDQVTIDEIQTLEEYVVVRVNQNYYYASLLIAADGKNSSVRYFLKHNYFFKNYNQYALVVNFLHSKNHNNTAYEMFFDSGPLATLPMLKSSKMYYSSSLIWSHNPDFVKSLDMIDDKLLLTIINEKIHKILGRTIKILGRQIFPLSAHINSNFSSTRTIFIGDAAHSIHPIAGQGWNVGMRDVSELIKIIIEAQSLGLELGSEYVCKKYQNQRYFDVFSFYQITDKLNSLFMLHNNGIKQLRQIGFNIIDNSRILKSKISHYAMGLDQ